MALVPDAQTTFENHQTRKKARLANKSGSVDRQHEISERVMGLIF